MSCAAIVEADRINRRIGECWGKFAVERRVADNFFEEEKAATDATPSSFFFVNMRLPAKMESPISYTRGNSGFSVENQ